MILTIKCDFCGKEFNRNSSQCKGKKHLFCSKECLAKYSSKKYNPNCYLEFKDYTNISKTFKRVNVITNKTRMTPEVKEKIRNSRLGTGNGKSYKKTYGRHTHRVVAEQILGRPLRNNEVVHHIDGNKLNNNPTNLVVLNKNEHARLHGFLNASKKEWEKANEV